MAAAAFAEEGEFETARGIKEKIPFQIITSERRGKS